MKGLILGTIMTLTQIIGCSDLYQYQEGRVKKETYNHGTYTLVVDTDNGEYRFSVAKQGKSISALDEGIKEGSKIRFATKEIQNYFDNDKIGSVPSRTIEVLE